MLPQTIFVLEMRLRHTVHLDDSYKIYVDYKIKKHIGSNQRTSVAQSI
jgi:hypothetical protein